MNSKIENSRQQNKRKIIRFVFLGVALQLKKPRLLETFFALCLVANNKITIGSKYANTCPKNVFK